MPKKLVYLLPFANTDRRLTQSTNAGYKENTAAFIPAHSKSALSRLEKFHKKWFQPMFSLKGSGE